MAFATLEKTESMKKACDEIIEGVLGKTITKKDFEDEKIRISKKYNLEKVLKNAEVFQFVEKNSSEYEFLKRFFSSIKTSSNTESQSPNFGCLNNLMLGYQGESFLFNIHLQSGIKERSVHMGLFNAPAK